MRNFWLVNIAVLLAAACGCTQRPGVIVPDKKQSDEVKILTRNDEVRHLAMGYADSYVTQSVQAMDELSAKTKNPEVAAWSRQQKLSLATAAFTNAAEPNPHLAVIDLVILVSMRRAALENHWIPNLLHQDGEVVLTSAKRAENEAWQLAAHVLSHSQREELKDAIAHWMKTHPEQYYVGWGRLTDFAVARNMSADSPEAKMPSSIFSLLYIDPLSNLDPVAQEMKNYRDVADRLMYLVMRMPLLIGGEMNQIIERSMRLPETTAFVGATTRFADSTDRFASEAGAWPAKWSAVAADQQGGIKAIMTDVRQVLTDAEAKSAAINQQTAGTIDRAADSSVRIIWHAAAAGLLLLVVAIIGFPMAMLRYKRLSRAEAAGRL